MSGPVTCCSCTRPAFYSCAICGKMFCHQKSGCKETLLAHACKDVEAGVQQAGKPGPSSR
jgi:hypothetical protein